MEPSTSPHTSQTHMLNSGEAMFDCKLIDEPVVIGDGKKLRATKIGKARMTAVQVNGATTDVVLHGVKHVPGLDMNLFSILKSIDQGWKISNEDKYLVLTKGSVKLKFDRTYETKNGRLLGINIRIR